MAVRLLFNLLEGICSNRCVWCYQHELKEKLILPFSQIKAFLDNNSPIQSALFMGVGESLDHPEFTEIIQDLNSRSINLPQFNTSLISPNFERSALGLTYFKNLIVEIGGGTEESRMINMGTPLSLFLRNLKYLLAIINREKTNVCIKMLANKNNYETIPQVFEIADQYQVKCDIVTIQVHDIIYFKEIIKSINPEKARDKYIKRNFDKKFPVEIHATPMQYDRFKHEDLKDTWFIGADGYLYPCQLMSQLRKEKYKLGKIDRVFLEDVKQTDKYKELVSKMQKSCATSFCSKFCPY